MAFGQPNQRNHMMKGVAAAMRSPKTPAHLKPHLRKRMAGGNDPLATTEPQDDDLMAQAARTPANFDGTDPDDAINDTEEQYGAADIAPKRDVSQTQPLNIGSPKPVLLGIKGGRVANKQNPKRGATPPQAKVANQQNPGRKSALFGDYGPAPRKMKRV